MSESDLTKLMYFVTLAAFVVLAISQSALGWWIVLVPLAAPVTIASVALANGRDPLSAFGKFVAHALASSMLIFLAVATLKVFTGH